MIELLRWSIDLRYRVSLWQLEHWPVTLLMLGAMVVLVVWLNNRR